MFNYVLAVYLFKIGVRHNDESLISSGRYKFDDLFYAFHLKNCVLYPTEVRALRDKNMSYSCTTQKGESQGGDFILEGKVKRQKLIAPKGPIKGDMWKIL